MIENNVFILSIIIPVWNGEAFITRILNNLTDQNTKSCEIIIINDGSNDKTKDIINNFIINKESFKLITLEENEGVSEARNVGLRNAKGKYILFLDSDDILPEKTLDFYRDYLLNKETDIFVFGYAETKSENSKNLKIVNNSRYNRKIFNTTEYLHLYFSFRIKCLICSIVFKRDFLTENNLEFPNGMKYGEDTFFYYKAFILAKNICYNKRIVFIRIFRYNSATQAGKIYIGYKLQDFIGKIEQIKTFIKAFPQIRKTFNYSLASFYFGILKAYLFSNKKDKNVNIFLVEYNYLLKRSMIFLFPKTVVFYILKYIPLNILLFIFKK